MNSSREPKTTGPASDEDSKEKAPSPPKSAKAVKSPRSQSSEGSSGIDSNNAASSHTESEKLANDLAYLTLMNPTLDQDDVANYLRQKRFYLNQVWQLLSAIHKFAPDNVFELAMEAARSLSDHISDSVVRRYDANAVKNGRKTLTEQAAKDVEKIEERMLFLFNITDPIRHKDWKPEI